MFLVFVVAVVVSAAADFVDDDVVVVVVIITGLTSELGYWCFIGFVAMTSAFGPENRTGDLKVFWNNTCGRYALLFTRNLTQQ